MTTGQAMSGDAPAGFVHAAVIIRSDRALHTVLISALNQLLQSGQPVLMVVGAPTAALIREGLRADAGHLQWGDPARFYQRLGFAYEGFRRFLAAQHAAGQDILSSCITAMLPSLLTIAREDIEERQPI
ncbi:hypothetical protein ACQPZX_35110 [Actinoplanes sp. CA-142083]|uniref:hypothetical protein n=1 Tax=Actinoplanes sp. CA-142083 TaxID=3239903 RepID=UPI003D92F0A2